MSTIPSEKINSFFSTFKETSIKKDSMLIEADKEPQGVFYIKEGFVREFIDSESGNELTIHIYEKGAHFPMTWAVNGTQNRHYFQALTDIKVNIAPKEKVVEFLKDNPDCLFYFTAKILRGLDGLSRRIEINSFGNARSKVISILLYLAHHFGKKNNQEIILEHKFTHQDIASLTGLSRERVSLEIEKLEKAHIISYLNHAIVISNMDLLET